MDFLPTSRTAIRPQADPPAFGVLAVGALEAFGPSNFDQILRASVLGGEATLEFAQRAGELRESLGSTFPSHGCIIFAYSVASSA